MVNDSINRKNAQKDWINSSNLACRGGIMKFQGPMHGVYGTKIVSLYGGNHDGRGSNLDKLSPVGRDRQQVAFL